MSKILILGNSKSRLEKKKEIKAWKEDAAICNFAYKEHLDFPKINIVGTVHDFCAKDILKFKKENNLQFEILSNEIWYDGISKFKNYNGWSTGLELIQESILRRYDEIWLSGFCFMDNNEDDVYFPADIKPYCGNFYKQWEQIKQKYPAQKFSYL